MASCTRLRPRVLSVVLLACCLLTVLPGAGCGDPANRPGAARQQLGPRRDLRATGDRQEADALARDELLRRKLARMKIDKLDFVDIELNDVISFLRDVTGLNIDVRWVPLTSAGIDRTTAVSVSLKDVTVKKALDVMLADLGGQGARLAYVVRDGVITISTKENLDEETATRVYNTRWLLNVPVLVGAMSSPKDPADQVTCLVVHVSAVDPSPN